MKIIISPFSKPLRDTTNRNPKNYAYWPQLLCLLQEDGHEVIQVGTSNETTLAEDGYFNMSLIKLRELLQTADCFISVDNFFHHFAHFYGIRGIVLFSKSDPEIFGYRENVNLLKNRKYLRPDQFGIWESCRYEIDAFVAPEVVREAVNQFPKAGLGYLLIK